MKLNPATSLLNYVRPRPSEPAAASSGVALFTGSPPPTTPQADVIRRIARRWRDYSAATIDMTMSPHDDMMHGDSAQYQQVGVSALDVISEAMLLARRTRFPRILDLPCGGGRVTRHLLAFFPDAEIFVSDTEKPKQDFVVSQFKVRGIDCAQDFGTAPSAIYDLIFVGSLFTHFDASAFDRALEYFINALAPEGLLVMSTHGRHVAARARSKGSKIANAIDGSFVPNGFGYVEFKEDTARYGMSYGVSFSSPAWIMQRLERRPNIAILSFKERAWAGYQDVVIVQKLGARPQRTTESPIAEAGLSGL